MEGVAVSYTKSYFLFKNWYTNGENSMQENGSLFGPQELIGYRLELK